VELHGGKIDFVSEVGRGSVFTLGLPLMHSAVAAQAIAH
jgi:signal transduction histidine kinase